MAARVLKTPWISPKAHINFNMLVFLNNSFICFLKCPGSFDDDLKALGLGADGG